MITLSNIAGARFVWSATDASGAVLAMGSSNTIEAAIRGIVRAGGSRDIVVAFPNGQRVAV